jgi:hypothetical protein
MQIQTIEERTGLVFDPHYMLEQVELDGIMISIPVRAIKVRVISSGEEVAPILADHDAILLRLVHEVVALRARVVALEGARPAAEAPDFGAIVAKLTPAQQDPGKIGPECFGTPTPDGPVMP